MNLWRNSHTRLAATIVALTLLGCVRARSDAQSAGSQVSFEGDTACPAYTARCELNPLSAPIDTLHIAPPQDDTLRWLAQPDGCAIVVLTRTVPAAGKPAVSNAIMVGEWYGNSNIGLVWDIAPSPDWRWLAYTQAHLGRSTAKAATPVVEPLLDDCYGGDCPLDSVPARVGGWQIGWAVDGSSALFASSPLRADGHQARWSAVDPATRQIQSEDVVSPDRPHWTVYSTIDNSSRLIAQLPAGKDTLLNRADGIWIRGPGIDGVVRERYVGHGTAVALTRNGEFVLAVVPSGGKPRVQVYAFRLYHAMMQSSCDRQRSDSD